MSWNKGYVVCHSKRDIFYIKVKRVYCISLYKGDSISQGTNGIVKHVRLICKYSSQTPDTIHDLFSNILQKKPQIVTPIVLINQALQLGTDYW